MFDNWFKKKIVLNLKNNSIKRIDYLSGTRFTCSTYYFILNEEIIKWLEENNIWYRFKSGRCEDQYSIVGEDFDKYAIDTCNPNLTFKSLEDALLFKLTWW